jgi:hypothetical protein
MFEPGQYVDPISMLALELGLLDPGGRVRLAEEVWVTRDERGRYLVSTPSTRIAGSPTSWLDAGEAARDAVARWSELSRWHRLAELTAQLPFRWHTEHSHVPVESAAGDGGRHIVLDEPLVHGRLRRLAGDALCRPRRLFWLLDSPRPADGRDVGCRRCMEIAGRLGG